LEEQKLSMDQQHALQLRLEEAMARISVGGAMGYDDNDDVRRRG
jgi:hypothetical protein